MFNLLFVMGYYVAAPPALRRNNGRGCWGGSESGFDGSIDQVLIIAKQMPN
jgi:hypothetical protein